jgi:hypothetical protein
MYDPGRHFVTWVPLSSSRDVKGHICTMETGNSKVQGDATFYTSLIDFIFIKRLPGSLARKARS